MIINLKRFDFSSFMMAEAIINMVLRKVVVGVTDWIGMNECILAWRNLCLWNLVVAML